MAANEQYFLTSQQGERTEVLGEMSVGRSSESDLVVEAGAPSRQHARLFVQDDGLYVQDSDSTNGTFVNGERIAARVRLNHGDTVAFDANEFSLEVVAAALDQDRTMLNPPADSDRTTLRPVDTPAPKVAAPPVTPEPVEPRAEAPAPGSWADPEQSKSSKTALFSAEDLAKLRADVAAENVASDVPILHVMSGRAAGQVYRLNVDQGSQEWSIGSAAERDIVIADEGVSEMNTLLVQQGGRWKVVDQMSTNGTHVNGNKTIAGFLQSGDKLRIGTVECQFQLGAEATSSASGGASFGANKTLIGIVTFGVVSLLLFGAYYLLF